MNTALARGRSPSVESGRQGESADGGRSAECQIGNAEMVGLVRCRVRSGSTGSWTPWLDPRRGVALRPSIRVYTDVTHGGGRGGPALLPPSLC